ncbi:hypothetical protein [Solidesulfovibrio alcoholivorans]|uniref:hypothetical protein n=1 Tax=Solidesulfovibrio alcoholivorans TaxID=81406 RepID=UPI00049610C8|nr:hypothetical protein [Solidesulfovibrio alcoholivorans]
MATPWLDGIAAWTDQAAGFGGGAVATDIAACRAALVAAGVTVAGRAGCAAAACKAVCGSVTTAGAARAAASRAWTRAAAGPGRGDSLAAANASPAQAQGHTGTAGWRGRTVARPGAAVLALTAPQSLPGTGLRAVARLVSPFATRIALGSAVAPSVVLSSLVAIEQT